MEQLTADQLIQILNGRGTMGGADGELMVLANAELIRRIKSFQPIQGKAEKITSIFDQDAIKKEVDNIHCMIKDVHERIDQATNALQQLREERCIIKQGIAQWTDSDMLRFANYSNATEGAYITLLDRFKRDNGKNNKD